MKGNSLYSDGASAAVGIASGSFSQLQYSCNRSAITPGLAVRFEPPICIDVDLDVSCDNVDCNDLDPSIYPGAIEVCGGVDQDCDGAVDEDFDLDGDGATTCAGDCDDTNATISLTALERCNGIDNDCDGLTVL